jgi:hypothetical protein
MRAPLAQAVFVMLLLVAWPDAAAAQGSPYIPLDDPLLPMLEHLISRGDIADPSPLVRPFRRSDAVRTLRAALAEDDPTSRGILEALLSAYREDSSEARWRLEARLGAQAYTNARRDPLHPSGPDGVQPYLDVGVEGVFGNVVAVARPTLERRLIDDPAWPGRKNLELTGRHVDAYLSAQFKWVRLFLGQMDMNWGPGGVPGIGLSNYGYPRLMIGFELGRPSLGLQALAAELLDETDSTGAVIHRYFFAHRLSVQLSKRLTLGLWETTILAGPDRNFDSRYRNPVSLLLLANEYGLGDDGNILLGLDLDWKVGHRTKIQAQLAIDDISYENRSASDRNPDRWALTLAASGALGRRAGWRALYTQASSLAFRTFDPFENFTDAGIGLGRNVADNDQFSLMVSVPATPTWLLTPELTLLRQGEGRLTDPYPAGTARGDTPQIFIGVVEKTFRAAMGVSGRQGPLEVSANLGLHHIRDAGHVAGRTKTEVEGHIQFTVGVSRGGTLR